MISYMTRHEQNVSVLYSPRGINLIKIRFSQLPEVTVDSRPINLFKQGSNIKSYNYVKVLKQIMIIGTTTIRYNHLLYLRSFMYWNI